MAFQAKKYRPALAPEALRIRRLDAVSKASVRWILSLGIFNLLAGGRMSMWFHVRYLASDSPIMRSGALAFILLALYLRRTLREPENQAMCLDLLMLFFWCQTLITTSSWFGGNEVFGGEWFIALLNLGFAVALTLLRTRSSQLSPGDPAAKDARVAAKETIERLKSLLSEGKRVQALPTDLEGRDAPPKPLSESAPHLD